MRAALDELIDAGEFTRRHTSASEADRQHMLAAIGEQSVEALLDHTLPPVIRMSGKLELGAPRSPESVLGELRQLAARNVARTSLIGMGYYGTITPPVILRNVLENPAWYTAYTPYQPEISQGRLEALLNFQTMVAELTGFEMANASLLDEATAAAEAMTMARRLSKSDSNRFLVHGDTHPQTIAVLTTRAEPVGIELVVGHDGDAAGGCFGALFSLPTSSGAITDWRAKIDAVHAAGGLAVVATDLLACTLTVPPGQLGADIAIGSAQRFGVSMGFGGPHAAFIASGEAAARALPGRLVGVSTDTAGRPALRLALQTREQHIRREKATSNICTAQVLLANIAGFYAAWHGSDGLRKIAARTHRLTSMAADGLRAAGFALVNDTWFDTLQVRCDAQAVLARAAAAGIDLRYVDGNTIGFSFDETSNRSTVGAVLAAFEVTAEIADSSTEGLPGRRTDEFLTQSVFERHHSEHEMLRYLRRLADKDLALDRSMIPLGSCTMKLNATVEMEPLTWPGLADMHPFTPQESTIGIREMISQLESMLLAITGYDAISLQPNAGSQGEFSGLLAIRAYHRSRGEAGRNICLIPSSAHGTNAASAVMAGLKVVVVRCDERGNIDLDDMEAKAAAAGAELAAAMVTYPSTHGVFEAKIAELCEIVHRHGGQMYVDGANLNAMVGLAQPGKFGADVSHLNLHKTFCIPHGGGGPGVGPVAVRAHLAEFLPAHPLASAGSPVGAVAAAPIGSAAILSISWVYIALMGAAGLTDASAMAVLNANYLATRLDPHFPVLYTGEHGRVAHECIIDLRPITKATGVTVDDVAKRLIDYGFHAPTMSFPVSGTLMIEPTESESLYELDRFCEAMIAIKGEIDAVSAGTWPVESSPLRHAPHTAEDLIGEWDRPYDRQLGAYPLATLRAAKYFPPVSRIDAAYGDRHLICTCEPLEALAAASA
ncbi:MAG TPA: aminomethyl-transferring glycine dehydrogenase [Ilumatobacteraceae bacterium]|nr:aminomethyl-transferring glycine dehydrogenase [Ilumatobacteraceae bacterium]